MEFPSGKNATFFFCRANSCDTLLKNIHYNYTQSREEIAIATAEAKSDSIVKDGTAGGGYIPFGWAAISPGDSQIFRMIWQSSHSGAI